MRNAIKNETKNAIKNSLICSNFVIFLIFWHLELRKLHREPLFLNLIFPYFPIMINKFHQNFFLVRFHFSRIFSKPTIIKNACNIYSRQTIRGVHISFLELVSGGLCSCQEWIYLYDHTSDISSYLEMWTNSHIPQILI